MNDEAEIRTLLQNWAKAVHTGNLQGVLSDHADDIVMFDVPPPNELQGMDAYRQAWPPFFEWQKQGPSLMVAHEHHSFPLKQSS